MTEYNNDEAEAQLTNEERYEDTSLTAEVDDEDLLESFGFGGDDE